jgi:hypothetical protein
MSSPSTPRGRVPGDFVLPSPSSSPRPLARISPSATPTTADSEPGITSSVSCFLRGVANTFSTAPSSQRDEPTHSALAFADGQAVLPRPRNSSTSSVSTRQVPEHRPGETAGSAATKRSSISSGFPGFPILNIPNFSFWGGKKAESSAAENGGPVPPAEDLRLEDGAFCGHFAGSLCCLVLKSDLGTVENKRLPTGRHFQIWRPHRSILLVGHHPFLPNPSARHSPSTSRLPDLRVRVCESSHLL